MKKARFAKKIVAFLLTLILLASIPTHMVAAEVSINGDVDGDGEITIMDATKIQRYLAELNVDAPIGEPKMNNYEPIELNFIPVLEMEEVSEGEDYHIYNRDELTPEILEHRAEHNTLIVERLFVRVTEIDPTVTYRAYGTVIGYDDTVTYLNMNDILTEGTIMLTYRIYDPNSNAPKAYANRYDFILDRRYENNGGI